MKAKKNNRKVAYNAQIHPKTKIGIQINQNTCTFISIKDRKDDQQVQD